MPRVLTIDTLIARGWPPHAARSDLACNLDNAGVFFVDHGGNSSDVEKARAICVRCPALAECLEWALNTRQAHGLWGAATTQERAAMLRNPQLRAAAIRYAQTHALALTRPE